MGSHAGGTAEGQKKLLATLGVTEESIGCDIRSSMKTLEVARTDAGTPVYLDEHAAGAHYILPVNRVKPHTCFKGPIESGCTKMAVVGFGAQNPDDWMVSQMRDDPSLASAVAGLYDDALHRVDAHVGEILEGLKSRGALDHTIVIVAGDHGQALGEGGHIGHQGLLQPEVLNVPLLVRMPLDMPDAAHGLRVDADVGLVDMLPTIVDLVDATPPATLDGRSLVPLLEGKTLPERGALAQAVVLQPDGRGLPTEVLVHGPLWLTFPMHEQGPWTLRRLSHGVWEPVATASAASAASAADLAAPMLAERTLLSGVEAPPGTPAALTAKQKEELRLQGYW
jgi:hypothetical protein